MIALSGACGSEAHAGGNLPEFTDGRYRRRNLPFNGTTADDEVGWKRVIPDLAAGDAQILTAVIRPLT